MRPSPVALVTETKLYSKTQMSEETERFLCLKKQQKLKLYWLKTRRNVEAAETSGRPGGRQHPQTEEQQPGMPECCDLLLECGSFRVVKLA